MVRNQFLIAFCMVAIFFVTPGITRAETDLEVLESFRAQLRDNRQEFVSENLILSEEESERFWPLYREYENARIVLEDRRLSLLMDFSDKFDSLTDKQSTQMLTSYLEFEDDLLSLQRKYAKKFRKEISEKQTLRYFQIENQIDSIINFELSQLMPLAE